MTAFNRTATTTGSPTPRPTPPPAPRSTRPTFAAGTPQDEAARHVRFWASYDANPLSRTAWSDAALSTWRRPAAVPPAPAREGLEQWDDDGGHGPG